MKNFRKFYLSHAAIAALSLLCSISIVSCRSHDKRASQQPLGDVNSIRLGAQQEDPEAELELANAYYFGRGVQRDKLEAFRWYLKSAKLGNAVAQFDVGSMYESGDGTQKNYAKALDWYMKSASKGNLQAKFRLGNFYYYGKGVPENYQEAALWYRQAAEDGLAEAQFAIGYLYEHGEGVPKDPNEARRWYLKASNQNDESAQKALGFRIRVHNIVQVVIIMAVFLWSLRILWPQIHSLQKRRTRVDRSLLIGGFCGLMFSLFGVYRAFGVFHTSLSLNLFIVAESCFLGIFFASSLSHAPYRFIQSALGLCSVVLLAIGIIMGKNWSLLPFSAAFRGFLSVICFLICVICSLVYVCWRMRHDFGPGGRRITGTT